MAKMKKGKAQHVCHVCQPISAVSFQVFHLRCSTLNEVLLQKVMYLVEKKGADVNKADIEQWTPVGCKFKLLYHSGRSWKEFELFSFVLTSS